jgi:hypothetical protein
LCRYCAAAGRAPTNAEFSRGLGWDERLVSGVEAEEGADFGDDAYRGYADDATNNGSNGYSFLRTDCRADWWGCTR